jgi:hypothetical protein
MYVSPVCTDQKLQIEAVYRGAFSAPAAREALVTFLDPCGPHIDAGSYALLRRSDRSWRTVTSGRGHTFGTTCKVAHIFHNCKRSTVGLPETRTRKWLLDIEFRKRETFAYACEAYSRIVDLARTPATRVSLAECMARGPSPSDERVDPVEYLDIVREAAGMRNGWKRILSRCAPGRRSVRADAGRNVPGPLVVSH